MRNTYTFAFNRIDAHRGCVEQQVDNMVVKQVYLVDIQQSTVYLSKQTWLKTALTFRQGVFKVERTDHTIFRCRNGKFNQTCRASRAWEWFTSFGTGATLITPSAWLVGITAVWTANNDSDLWQKPSERTNCGGLCCSFFASNQYAAYARVNRVEDQGALETVLTDESAKRIYGPW